MGEINQKKRSLNPQDFNKYMAKFNVTIYGQENMVNLEGNEILFIDTNLNSAKVLAFYEVVKNLQLQGVPVHSLEITDVYEVDVESEGEPDTNDSPEDEYIKETDDINPDCEESDESEDTTDGDAYPGSDI